MRRIRTLVLVAVLLSVAGLAIAEYQVIGKDVYPVSRPIVKIYSYRLGYKIIFDKENGQYGAFYVPLGWFAKAGGEGEIVWGSDPAYPMFTAFYVDGKFNHIRLYLLQNQQDSSWSVLVPADGEEKRFEVTTLDIPF